MDKAIIFGIYEFLGFQLCLDLLEKGIEVKGIDFEMNRTDFFIEEKKMLIGRNGNFQEESLNDFILTDKQNDTFIFIDYYSYYIKQAEKELLSAISSVCLDGNAQFVFLFPIQLSSEMQEKKKPFLPKNVIDNYSISFYLPTIYGPWQPVEFSFQQSLLHPETPVLVTEREWTRDAIYIDDAVQTILQCLEYHRTKRYLLRSTFQNHWQRIANTLMEKKETNLIESSSLRIEKDIIVMDVGQTKIEDGIEKQKTHLNMLLKRRF